MYTRNFLWNFFALLVAIFITAAPLSTPVEAAPKNDEQVSADRAAGQVNHKPNLHNKHDIENKKMTAKKVALPSSKEAEPKNQKPQRELQHKTNQNVPSISSKTSFPQTKPDNAVVLFDGKNRGFVNMKGEEPNWPIEAGAIISTQGGSNVNHLVSRYHFRDANIHVEFQTPIQGTGNSGVYLHGNYELQICNPRDKPLEMQDIGSLYGFAKPLARASLQAGEWQSYNIRYIAPRRDEDGKIIRKGSVTAWLNGQLVQNKTRFEEARSVYHPYRHGVTPYGKAIWEQQKKSMTGPVFLQDHSNAVKFRNVWVQPLDDKAYWYEPK